MSTFSIEVPPQHYLAGLTELEHRAARYQQLATQKEQWQAHLAQQEMYRSRLSEFFTGCGLPMPQDIRACLRQLREDTHNLRTAETEKQQLEAQLSAMEQEWGDSLLAAPSIAAAPKLLKAQEQQLRQEITGTINRLLRHRQQAQQLRDAVSEIPQLREELDLLLQRKAEDRENVRILDDTMEFLRQAKESLSTSYLGTIRSRFGQYLAQLDGAAGERYFVDADFGVQLERGGQARELAYFSAGQADAVMLCMRLALVDALFRDQEVFVILDDPFVNLDDEHTAQALALLRKLSADRQILYLTCHSSRSIIE